jgi:hypothetical protein
MAEATLRYLREPAFQAETRRRAYEYARPMFWPNVGRQYLKLFDQVAMASEKRLESPRLTVHPRPRCNHHTAELIQGSV